MGHMDVQHHAIAIQNTYVSLLLFLMLLLSEKTTPTTLTKMAKDPAGREMISDSTEIQSLIVTQRPTSSQGGDEKA
jgi:hypothetical protein